MGDEVRTECREVPQGQLYLEQVERAAMGQLVECILNREFDMADRCVDLMVRLSIV